MQEFFRVVRVDFLARLVVDLRLVHEPLPRLQEVLSFVPPVGIIRRKDNVVRHLEPLLHIPEDVDVGRPLGLYKSADGDGV